MSDPADPVQTAAPGPTRASKADMELVGRLLAGDEAAFTQLVRGHQRLFMHIARGLTGSDALAEEIVQETWVAVLESLPRFEGRSSLRTWMSRILVYRGRQRATKERRNVPMSSLAGEDEQGEVDPSRFDKDGHWTRPPASWGSSPEKVVMDGEVRALVETAVEKLPENQKMVLTLRDIGHLSSEEVCDALGVSEANQRVLLHRARTRVRAYIAKRFEEADDPNAHV
ncbi:MAG: sigma-70 family RNA polymerase sigma factor [Myxococcota bacterium]